VESLINSGEMTIKIYKWKVKVRNKFEHSLAKLDREMIRSGEPSKMRALKNYLSLSDYTDFKKMIPQIFLYLSMHF
jgi:hypothetical protein